MSRLVAMILLLSFGLELEVSHLDVQLVVLFFAFRLGNEIRGPKDSKSPD